MSKGALSLVLLLGSVNAACHHAGQGPVRPQTAMSDSVGAPPGTPVQVWAATAGRRLTGALIVRDSTIFGAGLDRKVYALDLRSGERRWATRLGAAVVGGLIVSGDTVFVATNRPDGRVYALKAGSGRRIWRTAVGSVGAPLALVDSVLVAQTQRGDIVGLDAGQGSVRWRRKLGTARIPAVRADSASVVVATVDSLFRLDIATGHVLHRAASPGTVVSPWIEHQGLLVAGTTDSLIVGVDADSLRTRWRRKLDAPVLDSPAASGDTLYAVTRRGTLYRLTGGASSEPVALAHLGWAVTAPVTILDGLVLLGGADGALRALRPDGREVWRLQLRWPVELKPVALDDGMLAVGGRGDIHRYRR